MALPPEDQQRLQARPDAHPLRTPRAPERYKRETTYVYSQGAPSVFKGDLNYYVVEHDLTDSAQKIDTSQTALHVLNGEYDWSAYPAAGEELAAAVPGATFTLMEASGTSRCRRTRRSSRRTSSRCSSR